MLVNQKDIAREVGVSQKTVSLYFKDRNLISGKTRSKIAEAVKKYNYMPNLAARSIQSKKFNRIACVVVQYGDYRQGLHPHLLSYMNGINAVLSPAGYSMIFEPVFLAEFTTHGKFPEFFDTLSIDGVIGIPGTSIIPEVDERINRMNLPTVWLNRKSTKPDLNCIYFDEYTGIEELVRYLINKGFNRLAWFGPEIDNNIHYSVKDRYNALQDCITRFGGKLTFEQFAHPTENPLIKSASFARNRKEFDAIICYNFQFRETIFYTALLAGEPLLEYPVYHFASNWEKHRYYDIYTTVMMPEAEIGQCAAQYLLKRIAGEEGSEFLAPLPTHLHTGVNKLY